ncbi:MAG: pyridoxal phosphate-dependent aminotransferase [Sandaracinaceae bacterium]|nr:pyridoxal phosphate-dependent aminotransferase [Sandaracinaceae bacterium]
MRYTKSSGFMKSRPASGGTPVIRRRAVVVHSLSKAYAMAGARIGFVHAPPHAMAAIRGVQTFMTYCAPRPFQFAGVRALGTASAWLPEMRKHYKTLAQLAATSLGLPPPSGGTFLFFNTSHFRKKNEDTLRFLERCADHGILLTPGSACGENYGDWARLCFTALPPSELEEALLALRTVLEMGS